MSTATKDIKKESSAVGGNGGKRPNENNGDQGPNRPPIKAKRPNTKAYYALYVNGEHIRVHYLRDDGADWPGELRPGYAVAWVEEKTRNVHYFYFRLADGKAYVLRAFYRGRLGLDAQLLIPAAYRVVNRDTYRNASKWKDNETWSSTAVLTQADRDIFERKIIKGENAGGEVTIFLQVEWLADNEIGDTIENPIIIEDNDD